jgi:hypothetical protein
MPTMSFFKLSRISSPDLSSPLSTFSRIWSTILNAVAGPKSAMMRASSSSSSSESASSRFQRTNSSSRTPNFARVRSVPDTSFPKSRPFSWITRLIFWSTEGDEDAARQLRRVLSADWSCPFRGVFFDSKGRWMWLANVADVGNGNAFMDYSFVF